MRTRRRDRDARETPSVVVESLVVEFLVVVAFERESRDAVAVSYTHLTLPTIPLV